jgi:1,4-alpha-glucan branching enzyme
MGAPLSGTYVEVFNSDSEEYGGSNVINKEPIIAREIPIHEKPYSIELRIPPLGAVILRPVFE